LKLLLDTHAFVWWDAKDPLLPTRMSDAIASAENQVFVSSVSVWEIAVKRASGKLLFGGSIEAAIDTHGFHQLPISARHAEWVGSLQPIHGDPFDRMLIAQAQLEGLTLVTVDQLILRYTVARL
jgi:PIN domain nuclease of toxin-antitoxin system